MVELETRGMLVGGILCFLGLVAFVYGTINMTRADAISNSFLIVIGIFMGIAGVLVFATSSFLRGSIFT